MEKYSYYRLNDVPLYLEYAPQVFESKLIQNQIDESEQKDQNMDDEDEAFQKYGNTIFVKNLNFDTSEDKLKKTFDNPKLGKILSVRIVRNKADGISSKGYGFVELDSEENAKKAIKKLQGTTLDDHKLLLKISKKDTLEAEKRKRVQKLKRKQKVDESYVDNEDPTNIFCNTCGGL